MAVLDVRDIGLRSLLGRTMDQRGVEVDPTDPRRFRRSMRGGRPKALTSGSDGSEIGGARDWNEPFADRVDEPSVAARQPRDGDALDEGSALHPVLKDIGDARIEPAEQGVKAAQHSRLDHEVGRERLHPADCVCGFRRRGRPVAQPASDIA